MTEFQLGMLIAYDQVREYETEKFQAALAGAKM